MALGCTAHPAQLAKFECLPCRRFACFACARKLKERIYQCTTCQSLLTAIEPGQESKLAAVARTAQPLVTRLLGVPQYLGKRSVLLVLAGLALIVTPIMWAAGLALGPVGIVALVIVRGLEASMYFHIVQSSANGLAELEAPDVSSVWDTILGPVFRYLAASGPFLFAVFWYLMDQPESFLVGLLRLLSSPSTIVGYPGPFVALLVALALWPLLQIIAALNQTVGPIFDPRVWIATLAEMKRDYVVAAVGFYAIFFLEVLGWIPMLFVVGHKVPIPIVTGLLVTFLGYWPMALRGRLLGMAAEPYLR
jgi:hypothetical protein